MVEHFFEKQLLEGTRTFTCTWAEERVARRGMKKSAKDAVSSVFDITPSQQPLALQ